MTPEQEYDINNALLTLMYEWKIGAIDQTQALKEFKQCLKYYSRMEDVIVFRYDELVDERMIEHYGIEKTIEYVKQGMSEKIAKEALAKDCVFFEEVPRQPHQDSDIYHRHFRMKMEAIIQPQQKK